MTSVYGRKRMQSKYAIIDVSSVPNVLPRSDETFKQLASAVSSLKVPKSLLGWDLEELEALVGDDSSRESDSDDESEEEVEHMLPAQI